LDRGGVELLAIERQNVPVVRLTQPHRLFKHRIEDRGEIAGRGINDLQDLGGSGFSSKRRVALNLAFGERASKVSNDLVRIG
jgi:hypothetical protein